jgi:hypothetical protein
MVCRALEGLWFEVFVISSLRDMVDEVFYQFLLIWEEPDSVAAGWKAGR